MEPSLISEDTAQPDRRYHTAERILHLTLEIIYLLTGEDYGPLRKEHNECLIPTTRLHVSGDRSRSQSLIPVPPPHSLSHERHNEQKILELTNKMIELLTGEERDGRQDRTEEDNVSSAFPEGRNALAQSQTSEGSVNHSDIGALKNRALELRSQNSQSQQENSVKNSNAYTLTENACVGSDPGESDRTVDRKSLSSTYILVYDTVSVDAGQQHVLTAIDTASTDGNKKLTDTTGHRMDTVRWENITSEAPKSDRRDQRTRRVREMVCPDCGKHFSCKSQLDRHQKIHTGEKLFLCSDCGKRFTLKSALRRHQLIHTGEKPHVCYLCGKRFNQRSHYVRHQLSHTGKRPFSCLDCGKRFIQKSDLVKHQRAHVGKNWSCLVCAKEFCSKTFLIKHQRTHAETSRTACLECGKCFTQNSALIVHRRIHTGEKPFTCSDCGKFFSRKSLLVRHQRTHTGEKPFSCPDCGKTFTRTTNLVIHQRIHTGEKPYSCDLCDKSFNNNATLMKHKRLHLNLKTVF